MAELLAFAGAHVIPIDGDPFDGTVLVTDGRITAVDAGDPPVEARVIDAAGKWILPGFIDAHTHLGTHEEGEGWAGNDTNELTDPNTADVRALDAINPTDLGFGDALSAGITTVNVNPGSGNVIGGLTVAISVHGRVVDEMVLRSPSGLKAALGENPKRVYGDKKQRPATRLGTAAVLRGAFVDAQNYLDKRTEAGPQTVVPRDLKMEALGSVLKREIPWRQHSHRADDIATAIRVADEFGYRLIIDHGTEAHLLADLLVERNIPVLIGPLMTSRSKVELRNRSLANPGLLAAAGVEISIITDHPVVPIQFLVHQVILAVKEGLDPVTALRSITLHPARAMGVQDEVGSLTVGKRADLTIWSGDPLDAMQRAERVFLAGREVYTWDSATRIGRIVPA
ncbi:amidohydrolase [Nakamurella flavida]|uniref:Amidohydrolase n=1 Tax=Nakamurella flavida TaxID=363630 RepID=A0A938YL20_9ACTN|nr:amidohydrolase [Nakamurella flavida]MBM9477129.1 amidohydrolase [Nakamurella flavida]MDP9780075.1 imidazolonepropionase-like amidohydrolase [Nakamurella flavida]